jgi:hypothetical protein
MLGELLGEGSGRVIGTRVLPQEGSEIRMEVTIQGSGTLLGEATTETATYSQTVRPGGSIYGEGQVLYMTAQGEAILWRGFGVGRPTGQPPASRFAVCGAVQIAPPRLERLLGAATVSEYEIQADGTYHYTTQEWVAQPTSVSATAG